MTTSCLPAFLAALGLLGGPFEPDDARSRQSDLRCGSYCLYVALKALDFPVAEHATIEQELGQPTELGYSLHQLETVARDHGANTLAIHTTLRGLGRHKNNFACIAHVKTNHFILIYDIDDRDVYVADPPRLLTVSRDGFEHEWDGNVLLIAREPLAPIRDDPRLLPWLVALIALAGLSWLVWLVVRRPRAKRIRPAVLVLLGAAWVPFAGLAGCGRSAATSPDPLPIAEIVPDRVDLGALTPGSREQLAGQFTIRNVGTGELRIREVFSDCGCTVASLPTPAIAPGDGATVEVVVRPRGSEGPQSSRVRIVTTDPSRPTIGIPVTWSEVAVLACSPRHVDLGVTAPGEVKVLEAVVECRGEVEENEIGERFDDRFVSIRRKEFRREGGKTKILYIFEVAFPDPPTSDQGDAIDFSCRNAFSCRLTYAWKSTSRVTVSPPVIVLREVGPRDDVELEWMIEVEEGLRIDSVDVEFDGAPLPGTVLVTPTDQDQIARVRLSIVGGGSAFASPRKGRLVVNRNPAFSGPIQVLLLPKKQGGDEP